MGCGCGKKTNTQKQAAVQQRAQQTKQQTRTVESREIYRRKLAELSQPKTKTA